MPRICLFYCDSQYSYNNIQFICDIFYLLIVSQLNRFVKTAKLRLTKDHLPARFHNSWLLVEQAEAPLSRIAAT